MLLDGRGARRAPGGFAAWDRARRARTDVPAPTPPPVPTRGAAALPAAAAPKRRSPSTLHRLLKQAEREVADLERRRDALHDALVDAGADHVELARLGTELTTVTDALALAEERWLALAEEAES